MGIKGNVCGPCMTGVSGLFIYSMVIHGKSLRIPFIVMNLPRTQKVAWCPTQAKFRSFSCNESCFDSNMSFRFCQPLPVVLIATQWDLDYCTCQNE